MDRTVQEMIREFRTYRMAPANMVYKVSRLEAWERGHHYAPRTIQRWAKQVKAWLDAHAEGR